MSFFKKFFKRKEESQATEVAPIQASQIQEEARIAEETKQAEAARATEEAKQAEAARIVEEAKQAEAAR
ncbi:MAG: hypothetical protein RR090_00495, partial [Niameybacter sp.]